MIVTTQSGSKRVHYIKHGTPVADGACARMARVVPKGVKHGAHERIAEYVNALALKARRAGADFLCPRAWQGSGGVVGSYAWRT